MLEDKWKKILKVVLQVVLLSLLLPATMYCILQGRSAWAGVLLIAAGILGVLWELPYATFLILFGLLGISSAYMENHLVMIAALILALVGGVIAILDVIPLIKLITSGKYRTIDKTHIPEYLKENEITYRWWNKFKLKLKKK